MHVRVAVDIAASRSYLSAMFARVITLLAILAVAAMASLASAHPARLSVQADHAMHGSAMMQAAASGMAGGAVSCSTDQDCGSVDARTCELLCAGITVFAVQPDSALPGDRVIASLDLPTGATLASREPGLRDRPPRNRLI